MDQRILRRSLRGYSLVLSAATLWSFLGIIYRALYGLGLQANTIAFLRAGIGGLVVCLAMLIFRPTDFRTTWRGFIDILFYGVFGVAFFYFAYVRAILTAGAAVSAVLLYTAPAWVGLIAWQFLGEKITKKHLLALALSLSGVVLISQVLRISTMEVETKGIIWGLLSGLTYGLWSVLNKIGARRNNPVALQAYGLLIGSLVLLPFQSFGELTQVRVSSSLIFWSLIMAVGPTVGASVAYAAAMKDIPVSVASVVAMLEPVLAVVLAIIFLHEKLSADQIIGGCLILASVVLLRPKDEIKEERHGK